MNIDYLVIFTCTDGFMLTLHLCAYSLILFLFCIMLTDCYLKTSKPSLNVEGVWCGYYPDG